MDLGSSLENHEEAGSCQRASRSLTTGPATSSRSRSSCGGYRQPSGRSCFPAIWFYDPGSPRRLPARAPITFVDGDEGILRYRGYPIEQLAESSTYLEVAYLLLHGELPDAGTVRRVGATRSRTTRSSTRTCGSASWRASTTTPTRWGCSYRRWRRSPPSTWTPRTSSTLSREASRSPGSSRRCRRSRRPRTASAWECRSSTRTTRSTSARTSCR